MIVMTNPINQTRSQRNPQVLQVHPNHPNLQKSQKVETMNLPLNNPSLINTLKNMKYPLIRWIRTLDTLCQTSLWIGTKVDSRSTSSDAMNVISITTIPDIQKMNMWMPSMTLAMRSSISSQMLRSLAIRINLLIMVVLIFISEVLDRLRNEMRLDDYGCIER